MKLESRARHESEEIQMSLELELAAIRVSLRNLAEVVRMDEL